MLLRKFDFHSPKGTKFKNIFFYDDGDFVFISEATFAISDNCQ